jgi:UTP--glucose-1-phosphate uridylyltransferase
MLGLGHAILTGEPLIGNEPFAVVLADDICDCPDNGVISQIIEIYNQYQCSVVAIEEVPMSQTKKYGIIVGNLIDNSNNIYQVTDMLEKPEEKNAPSNMAIVGRYILTPDIFNILNNIKPDKNGEIQLTDALKIQAKQGKVIAYKFQGTRYDCGSIKGFVVATNHFAKAEGLI